MSLHHLLYILAFIFMVLAALGIPESKINLYYLSLATLILTLII